MPAYVQHRNIESALIVCPNCLGLPVYVRDVAPHFSGDWSSSGIDGFSDRRKLIVMGQAKRPTCPQRCLLVARDNARSSALNATAPIGLKGELQPPR